jgi:hypothetical protein
MEDLCRMCARVSDSTLSLLDTQNQQLQWTVRKFNIQVSVILIYKNEFKITVLELIDKTTTVVMILSI